jgi:hypothetical protein
MPVQAEIPVGLPISKTFTVEISRTVPIDLKIPVTIPIETEVTVPFSRTIPIAVEVPIGDTLRKLGQSLRQVAE